MKNRVVETTEIQQFPSPSQRSSKEHPIEFALSLLGELTGKTVLEVGGNTASHAVLLALLRAQVISVSSSDENLARIAERVCANGVEDRVTLAHFENGRIPVEAGSVDGVLCTRDLELSDCLELSRQIRRVLKPGGRAAFVQRIASVKWFSKWMQVPLTHCHIEQISRAVGRHGRQREFASSRLLASLVVWEARKEC